MYIIDYLKQCYINQTPVDEAIHEVMRSHLLNYIMVGGMPEVVCFNQTKQLNQVLRIQRRIIEEYKADMLKYAHQEDKPRIIECFYNIGFDNNILTLPMYMGFLIQQW